MTGRHIYSHLIICSLVIFSAQAVYSASYSTSKKAALQGSSDVLNSFMSSAQSQSAVAPEPVVSDDHTRELLMQKYRDASVHDPLADLLTLFPITNRDRLAELRAMNEADVEKMLADNPPEQRLIALVIARSPRITAAENAWHATLNHYPETLFLQDILNRYQSFTSQMTLGVGEEYQNGMIQMDYPAPGMLALRGKIVELDADSAYSDYLKEASETVADARELVAQIRNRDELISNGNASVSLLSILGEVANAQYVAGSRSFSDLVQLQTEETKRRNDIQRLGSERDGLLGQLAASMNVSANAEFGEIGWSDDSRSELDDQALRDELPKTRQEIAEATFELQKMDAMIEMTRRQAVPDPTLGMTYVQTNSESPDISGKTPSAIIEPSTPSEDSSGMDSSMTGMNLGSSGSSGRHRRKCHPMEA